MKKGILMAVPISALPSIEAVHYTRYGHHCTLQFGAALTREVEALIGERFIAKVVANCWNADIQALELLLPAPVLELCGNAHPHITWSAATGIKPKVSNEMFTGRHQRSPLNEFVEMRITFQPFY